MAWKPTEYQIGDRHPDIADAKERLRRIAAKLVAGRLDNDNTDVFSPVFADVLAEWKTAVHRDVLSGRRQPPDVDPTSTVIDWATKVQLGMIARATPPAPAPPKARHLGIVFRGTGGIIGQDYVSRVLQGCADLVEEVHPAFAATMGGIPVGTAGGINDPSMAHAVALAFADAQRIFLERFRANPRIRVVIGGYSAGAVAAAMFRQWLLTNYPDNYLCSFSFGDPTRPAGGAYFGGVAAPGRGISTWRFGDIRDYRHCWLAAPGDMYTSVPDNAVGDIMDTAYDIVTQVELSDFLGTAFGVARQIPIIMEEAGIGLPSVFKALAGGPAGLVGLGVPLIMGLLGGLIGGQKNPTGVAAAAQAAMIALQFATSNPPTAAHIQYEFREVWPGQTYLGLAIQHVRDWAGRTPAVTA
ncbi:lysin B [Mycobacterium phage Gancho]|uniref:Lysin B n=1 Tax=Mycobacterium phage Gancho TaxID=2301613 RepID=A0A385UHM6_9CAUD|nr:lysin B [Mycobacterium phage Gancho]